MKEKWRRMGKGERKSEKEKKGKRKEMEIREGEKY